MLPEGKVPAIAGQFFVVVSPEAVQVISTEHVRKKRVTFDVNVIHRIRDIPNDKFGNIYLDKYEMADIHDQIETAIESFPMFQRLLTLNATEKVPLSQVVGTENPEPAALPVRFSITREFVHNGTNLNPIHLYASYFLTKPVGASDQKIAGYKTVSRFTSPVFTPIFNPLDCELVTPYESP